VKKYSTSSIVLHTIQGVGLLFMLLTGSLVLSEMPNNVEKISSFAIHMILGLTLLFLTIVRIWFILVVIIAMGISGIVMSQLSGLGEIVFFGANQTINLEGLVPSEVHEILAKVLMFLIVMHVLGVFSYMVKTKENILKRMWF